MRPLRCLPILAVLAVLALAGCGGGGDDETTTVKAATTEEPSLTKAELISQGDAICAEVNAAVGAVGGSEGGVPGEIEEVSNLYDGMVESLKGLGKPKEEEGYAEFIAAAEELAKVEGEVKLAAEREDTEALGAAATKAAPTLEEFEAQAAVYGFEDCSEGPSETTAPPAGAEAGSVEEESGGVEVAPEEEAAPEEVAPEEAAPEEAAPEAGGVEEAAPEGGGTGAPGAGGETGGESGGVGPG